MRPLRCRHRSSLWVRELHGGKDYDPEFGTRMRGQGIWAELLRKRFEVACARLGLAERGPTLRSDLFEVPLAKGDQLALF